jgi:hypothetical protein
MCRRGDKPILGNVSYGVLFCWLLLDTLRIILALNFCVKKVISGAFQADDQYYYHYVIYTIIIYCVLSGIVSKYTLFASELSNSPPSAIRSFKARGMTKICEPELNFLKHTTRHTAGRLLRTGGLVT